MIHKKLFKLLDLGFIILSVPLTLFILIDNLKLAITNLNWFNIFVTAFALFGLIRSIFLVSKVVNKFKK